MNSVVPKDLSNNSIPEDELIGFLDACKKSLDYHTPSKRKYIKASQAVPQESVLRPLLFNTFLCDMFLFCKEADFATYANDTDNPHCIGKTTEEVIYRNLQYQFLNGLKIME